MFSILFFQYIILFIPLFIVCYFLIPILYEIYGKKEYSNLNDDLYSRVLPLLKAINKESYSLKQLDVCTDQTPCIVVTNNGILLYEQKIKNISDNALQIGLLYEIVLFEKKVYLVQCAIAIFMLLISSAFIFYLGYVFEVSHTFFSMLIFNGIALIIQSSLVVQGIECINLAQKKNIIQSIVMQSPQRNVTIYNLKEYFMYHKRYFDDLNNIKYDIDTLIKFLDSHRS